MTYIFIICAGSWTPLSLKKNTYNSAVKQQFLYHAVVSFKMLKKYGIHTVMTEILQNENPRLACHLEDISIFTPTEMVIDVV